MHADDLASTSTHISVKSQFEYDNVLINEVKKRKILWDRKQRQIGDKSKEWEDIASILNMSTAEVKSRFRNLRDTFHKEEKKLELPLADEGKPLTSYYTGHWAYFEKLFFLYGNRNAEHVQENVKEMDLSEHSLDSDEESLKLPIEDKQKMFQKSTIVSQTVRKNESEIYKPGRKRGYDDKSDDINKRKRTPETMPIDTDTDEDVLFVQSLVPFFKQLNPLRRLIVKNEMQNLLIKELICDHCRLIGPQPNCRCKLS